MKLTLQVTQTDGEKFEVTTNLYVIVSWERKFKRKSAELSTGQIGHEDLLFMAFEAAKLSNIPVPMSFDEFIKRVDDIDVKAESVNPTELANTEGN